MINMFCLFQTDLKKFVKLKFKNWQITMSLKRFELPTLKCHRSMSKGDIRFTFTKETDDDENL